MPIRLLGLFVLLFGAGTLAFGQKAQITEQEISPGVTYLHKTMPQVPWSVHVLRIEWARPDLQIVSTLPGGAYIGLTRLSDQVKFIPEEVGKPIGGINGDFFRWQVGPYQGDPIGMHIVDGELVSAPNYFERRQNIRDAAAFWMDRDNRPRITFVSSHFTITWPDGSTNQFGVNEERAEDRMVIYNRAAGLTTRTTNGVELVLQARDGSNRLRIGEESKMRVMEVRGPNTVLADDSIILSIGPKALERLPELKKGMKLTVSTMSVPDLKGSSVAVGGGPVLVQNGKVAKIALDQERNPRAALGWNEKYLFFVAVDGRRPGISDGMTYRELAREMASWDCVEAMNIDGGASAMIWIEGKIMNLPSENRERPNANSIFVVRRTSAPQPGAKK